MEGPEKFTVGMVARDQSGMVARDQSGSFLEGRCVCLPTTVVEAECIGVREALS